MKNQTNTRPQLNSLQKFEFAKTSVMAGLMTTGEAIALKPVVENLGLDWSSQLKRVKRNYNDDQLWSSKVQSKDGKSYDMICMSPTIFQDWLWSLNTSDNLNIELWEIYKKGLVVQLLIMLRISLDEIKRLRRIESLYKAQKNDMISILGMDEEAAEARRRGAERRKQKTRMLDRLRESLFTDPNQLGIED